MRTPSRGDKASAAQRAGRAILNLSATRGKARRRHDYPEERLAHDAAKRKMEIASLKPAMKV
jgi:hypothetical protein